jgi:prephenate dehydrogenase
MNISGCRGDMLKRCVVVGGSGAVGGMFAELLRQSGAAVCVIDSRPLPRSDAGRFLAGDIVVPSAQLVAELRAADLILLAVPERIAIAALPAVVHAATEGTLLAHTLSVHSRVAGALSARAAGLEAVGLNPMFAPALGIAGRPVVAAVVRDGPKVAELLRLVSAWGGRVIRVDVDRHDRLTAVTQALSHAAVLAFGLALVQLKVDVTELSSVAPPPCMAMLALLARMASGTPEVYWEVQAANPYAQDAREALRAGVLRVAEATASTDESELAGSMGQVGNLLGAQRGLYVDLCAEVFGRLSPSRTESGHRAAERSGLAAWLEPTP